MKTDLRLVAALAALALSACGGTTQTASNPTPTPAAPVAAACTLTAVMVPIHAQFDTAQTKATTTVNANLLCASGIAKITIFIANVPAPANGPQGANHLVLLEDQSGTWVIANSKLCLNGQPTKSIPATLGTVCGVP